MTGGCLCGGVRYESGERSVDVLQCHCMNCRRLTGNFTAAVRSRTDELAISDDAGLLEWHDIEYARYGFCRGCGSTLFFKATDRPENTSVMVGTLDDASALRVREVWFADERQPHNAVQHGVPHYDGNGPT